MSQIIIQATGVTDTWLDQINPTTNYNTNGALYAQLFSAGRILRSLVKFDTSSVPAGAIVTSATLTLTKSDASGTRKAAKAFRILPANASWSLTTATWNNMYTAVAWAGSNGCGTSGTDYSSTAMGSYADGSGTLSSPVDITLTVSEVQAMLAANHGILIRADDEASATTLNTWLSADDGTSGNRPKLTINYDLPEGGYIWISS